MDGRTFSTEKISHDHGGYGRNSAADGSIENVIFGGGKGDFVRTQKMKKRSIEKSGQKRKKNSAKDRTPKTKNGVFLYGVKIFFAQSAAHHAGTSDAEKVVDRIERKKKRRRKSYGGVLNGVPEHSHKEGVRKVINYHDQGRKHCGKGKMNHRFRNGHIFENFGFVY